MTDDRVKETPQGTSGPEIVKVGGGQEKLSQAESRGMGTREKLLKYLGVLLAAQLKKQVEESLKRVQEGVKRKKETGSGDWKQLIAEFKTVLTGIQKLDRVRAAIDFGNYPGEAAESKNKFLEEVFAAGEEREVAKKLVNLAEELRKPETEKIDEVGIASELESVGKNRGIDKNKFLEVVDKPREKTPSPEEEDLQEAFIRFDGIARELDGEIKDVSEAGGLREQLVKEMDWYKEGRGGGPAELKTFRADWRGVDSEDKKQRFIDAENRYDEMKSLNLGAEWRRFFDLIEKRGLDDQSPGWYRHLKQVSHFGGCLNSDSEFRDARNLMRALNPQREMELANFLSMVKYKADEGMARYQGDKNKFNWLLEENKLQGRETDTSDIRLPDLWGLFDNAKLPRSTRELLFKNLIYLSKLPSGYEIKGTAKEKVDEALKCLGKIDDLKLLNYLNTLHQGEERDRVAEFFGDLKLKLEYLRDNGQVPLSVADIVAQREAQQREVLLAGLGGGGRRVGGGLRSEIRERMAMQMAQQQKPPGGEGGENGGGGMSGVYMSEKLYMELATKAEESPRAAVEHMMNFLITHDVGERDQYYLMSYVKNLIAGEKGPIGRTQAETWILSSVYAEWLNELELFRALPGITSAEQLMSIGHSISTGSLQDIMEYKKDFSEWGGAIQLQIIASGQPISLPELKHFSVGGSDVEALFESDYWFKKFQYRGRGADMTPLREQILMEAMWLKLGGRASLKGDEKIYSLGDQNLTLEELKQVKLAFGNGREKTFQELAEENLWLGMVGEMNWELTGKRPEQNKYLEGRRTIYNWDKFFQYDVYAAKYGMAQGFDFFYSGYEEGRDRGVTSERKPLLDLKRNGFVSARAKSMIMAYLFSEGDKSWPDKDTGKVMMVKGIRNGLANGDGLLAKKLRELFEEKFFDARDRMREMEVFRHMFDSDEELLASYGVKSLNEVPLAVQQLRFTRGERELLGQARWDKLFEYLLESGNEGKISADEFEFFIEKMGGTVDWENRANRKVRGINNVAGLNQEEGAKLFFENFNRRWMFWEKDEHDRMLKENYYTKQAAEIASKMVGFAKAPTVDNLLNYIGPICAYSPNDKTQELAYRNMDMVLEARKRFNLRSLTAQTDMRKFTTEWEEYRDMDGYPMPQRRKTFNLNPVSWVASVFIDPEKVRSGIVERKRVGTIAKEAWENGVIYKAFKGGASYIFRDYWKEKGQQLEGSVEVVRTFVGGAAATKGWSTLDAWGRKNAIEKLWHTGTINWWQKEKLMAKHVAPAPVPIISAWLAGGLDADLDKGSGMEKFGKLVHKVAAVGLYYLPSKLTTWAYLYLWIHDWGKAQASFWNEIVAPAMFGESAKAVQVKA